LITSKMKQEWQKVQNIDQWIMKFLDND
jgi:hypothetical protein